MSILSMPVKKNNTYYLMETYFPMQTFITATGTMDYIDNTYYEFGCLWTVDKGSDKDNGTRCEFGRVNNSSYIVPTDNQYATSMSSKSGLYNVKYYSRWDAVSVDATIAHPVRCIQEPKN